MRGIAAKRMALLKAYGIAGTVAKPAQKKSEDWLPLLVRFLLTHPNTKFLNKVAHLHQLFIQLSLHLALCTS